MQRFFPKALVLLAMGLFVGACSSDSTTSTTTPTPAPINDFFSGTIAANGAQAFPFSVAVAGSLTASIVTLSDSTAIVGLSLGTWNGSSCQEILANDNATMGTSIGAAASTVGTLCVRIYDARGTLAGTTTFQLKVEHP